MTNKGIVGIVITLILLCSASTFAASTKVKGHQKDRYDKDGNGYSDAGVKVNGHYTSLYAYDVSGAYYWDLGDGRVYTSPGVADVGDLDSETVTACNYQNNYRADFGNDPFMNTGWIINSINCIGYEKGHYVYLIVHEEDPRYQGNPEFAVWGTWEYKVLTESGSGNAVYPFNRPESHIGE